MTVTKYSQIQIQFLKRKIKDQPQFTLFEIYYQKNYQPLITITPPLVVNQLEPAAKLAFCPSASKLETDFIQKMNDLDHHFGQEYPDYDWVPTIKKQPVDPYLKLKHKNLQIYDHQAKLQSIDYVSSLSTGSGLIYLKYFWINHRDRLMGLSWYLLQLKIKLTLPQFDHCLIPNDQECPNCGYKASQPQTSEPETPPLPEDYQKYLKMVKIGIPPPAIFQKCQLDGLDPLVLQDHPSFKGSRSNDIPASRPPAILPPSLPSSPPITSPPVTSLAPANQTSKQIPIPRPVFKMSNELLLRGISSLSTPPKHALVKKKTIDPRVPSLDMIMRGLNGLRKTKNMLKLLSLK